MEVSFFVLCYFSCPLLITLSNVEICQNISSWVRFLPKRGVVTVDFFAFTQERRVSTGIVEAFSSFVVSGRVGHYRVLFSSRNSD